MKTLTKRQALKATIKMWSWLAEHPTCDKDKYCMIHYLKNTYINNCPCCEYANQLIYPIFCDNCPLLKKWSSDLSRCAPCTHYDSPFHLWAQTNDPVERTKHANAIVAIAKQALAELPKTKTT